MKYLNNSIVEAVAEPDGSSLEPVEVVQNTTSVLSKSLSRSGIGSLVWESARITSAEVAIWWWSRLKKKI